METKKSIFNGDDYFIYCFINGYDENDKKAKKEYKKRFNKKVLQHFLTKHFNCFVQDATAPEVYYFYFFNKKIEIKAY